MELLIGKLVPPAAAQTDACSLGDTLFICPGCVRIGDRPRRWGEGVGLCGGGSGPAARWLASSRTAGAHVQRRRRRHRQAGRYRSYTANTHSPPPPPPLISPPVTLYSGAVMSRYEVSPFGQKSVWSLLYYIYIFINVWINFVSEEIKLTSLRREETAPVRWPGGTALAVTPVSSAEPNWALVTRSVCLQQQK